MLNVDKEYINDLVKYFKIHTDRIDEFLNSKIDMRNVKELYINTIVKDRLREVVKDMTKYECTKCKKTWYTSDTKAKKCEECNGKLENKGVAGNEKKSI